jgi:excisionase family DNA binding protein
MASLSQPEPLLIDVAAAAAYVGVPVSQIRRWTSDGLPYVRAGRGGKLLYDRNDLRRYIERLKESSHALV